MCVEPLHALPLAAVRDRPARRRMATINNATDFAEHAIKLAKRRSGAFAIEVVHGVLRSYGEGSAKFKELRRRKSMTAVVGFYTAESDPHVIAADIEEHTK